MAGRLIEFATESFSKRVRESELEATAVAFRVFADVLEAAAAGETRFDVKMRPHLIPIVMRILRGFGLVVWSHDSIADGLRPAQRQLGIMIDQPALLDEEAAVEEPVDLFDEEAVVGADAGEML